MPTNQMSEHRGDFEATPSTVDHSTTEITEAKHSGVVSDATSPTEHADFSARNKRLPTKNNLLKNKKLYTPAALAIVSLTASLLAVWLFPQDDQLPSPQPVLLAVGTSAAINEISYDVSRVGHSKYVLSIVLRSPSPYNNVGANVDVFLPRGWAFGSCYEKYPGCLGQSVPAGQGYAPYPGEMRQWYSSFDKKSRQAVFDVDIIGKNFGYAANGVTEEVAMPEVESLGNANARLEVSYKSIRAPENYDWLSLPPTYETEGWATWTEQMVNGVAASRVAIGTNLPTQARDNRNTFLAGALVGAAGAALIGALQESIDVWAEITNTPENSRRVRRKVARQDL